MQDNLYSKPHFSNSQDLVFDIPSPLRISVLRHGIKREVTNPHRFNLKYGGHIMFVYELRTKSGSRLYASYAGANKSIEEDINDVKSTIISDTRDGEHGGKVVTEYLDYWDNRCHDVYEIKKVPVYK